MGTTYSVAQLKELIAEKLGPGFVPPRFKIITDTSDFFQVDYNDVCLLDEIPYLMLNYTREGRFGLDDEPKYWVRKGVDLFVVQKLLGHSCPKMTQRYAHLGQDHLNEAISLLDEKKESICDFGHNLVTSPCATNSQENKLHKSLL